MNYLGRKRLRARLLNGVTLALVGVNLVPIAWMVYCGFKDNNEILSGMFWPGRRQNDVIFLAERPEGYLAGTSDGGVHLFSKDGLALRKHVNLGTFATAYLADKGTLWVLSSNQGLQEVDLGEFRVRRSHGAGDMARAYQAAGLAWKPVWVNEVAASSLAKAGDTLYLAYDLADHPGLTAFSIREGRFRPVPGFSARENGSVRALDYSDSLAVLTRRGLFLLRGDESPGPVLRVGHALPWAPERFRLLDSGRIRLEKGAQAAVLHHGKDSLEILPAENASHTALLPLAAGTLTGGAGGVVTLTDEAGRVIGASRTPRPSLYIHWRNYLDLWRTIDFALYLKNSLIVCLGVMAVAMLLASLGGYALARYRFPGRDLFGYSILATQMVPAIMLLLPIYLMFINFTQATGLVVKGTYGGLILTYAAYFVPFSIWILRGFFASIPKELEEAALLDGCGPFQAFFRVIVPAAMPGIIATGVYVFLSAWDELMFAWVLTNEKTYTIPVGIRLFVGNYQNRFDLMMAAATVSTLPVLALFFLMQKQIVSGLTAGAVKH